MNALFALIMFSSLPATNYALKCTMPNGGRVNLTVKDSQIQELTVEAYSVIKNGKQLADREIGRMVFDVKVKGPVVRDNGRQIITLRLQDYSDKQSWKIFVSRGGRKATMTKTYQSSDGDNQVHISRHKLNCRH